MATDDIHNYRSGSPAIPSSRPYPALAGYTAHARQRHSWGLNMSCHRVEAGGGKKKEAFDTVTQNVAAAIETPTFGTLQGKVE